VVRGEPSPVRGEGALPSEELLALVEPVEGVLDAVVRGEVELGVAWGGWAGGALAGVLRAASGRLRKARVCRLRKGGSDTKLVESASLPGLGRRL
jgi:hypothetical protein